MEEGAEVGAEMGVGVQAHMRWDKSIMKHGVEVGAEVEYRAEAGAKLLEGAEVEAKMEEGAVAGVRWVFAVLKSMHNQK